MVTNVQEIKQEIEGLTNCIKCVKSDGCYMCREQKPNLKVIREMLYNLMEYKKL